MKKNLFFASIVAVLAACGNNSTTTTDGTQAPSTTNVENVNGNVPDTTGGATLNNPLPQDSSKLKDSTRR